MLDRVKDLIVSLPETARWSEMVEVVLAGRPQENGRAMWEYPLMACKAVGGTPEQALPGMAAIAAMMIGVHQIDDMLDLEPDGVHHRWGWGKTANIALAFHMAGLQILYRADLSPEVESAVTARLTQTGMHTAWGQHLDVNGVVDEVHYWQCVDAKTPPLLGAGLYIGALLGGGSLELADEMSAWGGPLGRLIQIGDDIDDAFKTPARSDWRSQGNNLAILYAMIADHPLRERFHELLSAIDTPAVLDEAQQILVSSGALSYCCYHYMEGYKNLADCLQQTSFKEPAELKGFVHGFIKSLRQMFQSLDLPFPEGFLQ